MAYSLDPRAADSVGFTDYRGRKFAGSPRAYLSRLKAVGTDADQPEPLELAILRELDPLAEPLLHCVFVLGQSYHEIGRREGRSASTILRQLRRRLQQLREEIERRLKGSDPG